MWVKGIFYDTYVLILCGAHIFASKECLFISVTHTNRALYHILRTTTIMVFYQQAQSTDT